MTRTSPLWLALVVVAVFASGCASAAAPTPTPEPPAPPSNFHAMTVHDRLMIQLMWDGVPQGVTHVVVERSITGEDGPWEELATVAAGSDTYSDMNLAAETVYYYRAKSRGDTGDSAWSDVVSAEATDLPTPPG